MSEPRGLVVEGIAKRFASTHALRGVDLEVRPGEVIGLIGANGAGKSTLVKVLAGAIRPDAGRLLLDGAEVSFASPRAALDAGIALNPQEIVLVGEQSVADNLMIGNQPSRFGVVRSKAMRRRARELLAEVGLEDSVAVNRRASTLTAVEARLVSVAEVLSRRPRILILDEPSAALPTETARRLEPIIRRVAAGGSSVILVSHRLGEVRQLADRVVAMRDGGINGTLSGEEATEQRMVELVGGVSEETAPSAGAPSRETKPILTARGLSGTKVRDVDLDLRPGEIVGVGGLYGSGRSELLRLIAGAQQQTGGELEVFGRPAPSTPRAARALGIGYVTESRSQMLFPELSIAANATIAMLRQINPLLVDRRVERRRLEGIAAEVGLDCNPADPVRTLSGGNQQKVCLARWLLRDAKLLLLDEPTAGIDVHARAEIHALLRRLAGERGTAILMASGEPEELVQVCDRVVVMVEGEFARELEAPFDADRVVAASYASVG